MRLITTFLIATLFHFHSFSQNFYSETRTSPTTYTTTGAAKTWAVPYSYAMSGAVGAANQLSITNWGYLSIPSNALSITGVVFSFNYANAANVEINRVQLVNSNGSSADLVTTNLTPTGTGSYSFGTSTGLGTEWGNVGTGPLTAADILTAQFGVVMDASKITNSSGKLDINSVSLTVYFTAALPVTLSKFDVARINGDQVAVNWETTSEANVDMLYVERSKDGRNFNTLFEVVPRGKSNGNTLYQVTDKTPINGTGYYRLRERDLDGLNKFYPVQKITINSMMTRFHAKYMKSFIAVDLSGEDGSYQVSLVNLNGQLISRTPVEMSGGNVHLEINAATLNAGIYLVNVYGNGINRTEKVMVAR